MHVMALGLDAEEGAFQDQIDKRGRGIKNNHEFNGQLALHDDVSVWRLKCEKQRKQTCGMIVWRFEAVSRTPFSHLVGLDKAVGLVPCQQRGNSRNAWPIRRDCRCRPSIQVELR